jgi:low temperature requirement protein LtrA
LTAEQLAAEPLTEPEQKVSVLELFFDLVFVSALTKVTARMRAAS